jgi:hypothetical protein
MTNHPIQAPAPPAITLTDDNYTMQDAPQDEELEKAIAMSMVEAEGEKAEEKEKGASPPVHGPPKPISTSATVLERLLEVVLEQFKGARGRGGVATIPYLQVVHALTKKCIIPLASLPPPKNKKKPNKTTQNKTKIK